MSGFFNPFRAPGSRDRRPRRSPRYAPESLEPRLSPSSLGLTTSVDTLTTTTTTTLSSTSTTTTTTTTTTDGTEPPPPDGDGTPPYTPPGSGGGPAGPA